MEKKPKIAQYRERLDNTLASPELTSEETLKMLVKNQLMHSSLDGNEGCSENVVERKTAEISSFLGMLRSASVKDKEVSKTSEASHGEWKLKQDTEEFRVMYREGPHGTPFHSLLVEGYVEAPLDVCLCVSWESALYTKWWPQYIFPQFKIITSNCLKKIRVGEQISLVRVKVPWPLSCREGLVHYFSFDYFQDGLVVVLINSISDLKSIDKSTHGFTSDGIPEAKDVVRVDLVGGFALQKVTEERSYFRTIANMDIKLDFVPPSLINFISRQLIGNGFKLYQKAVVSVSTYNEDYRRPLEGPLYFRIREALYSTEESEEPMKAEELKNGARILPEEHFTKAVECGPNKMEQMLYNVTHDGDSSENNAQVTDINVVSEIEEEESGETTLVEKDNNSIHQSLTDDVPKYCNSESLQNDTQVAGISIVGEIEEEEIEGSICSDENDKDMSRHLNDEIPDKSHVNMRKKISISPGVEQALETLETAISMVREYGFNSQSKSFFDLTIEKTRKVEMSVVKESTSSENRVHPDVEVCKKEITDVELSEKEITENNLQESRKSIGIQDSRRSGSNSYLREGNHNKIAPASLEDDLSNPDETNQVAVHSSRNGMAEIPILDQRVHDSKQKNAKANEFHDNTSIDGRRKLSRQKKQWLCCFFINSA
ncbi:polyketide cyclase/dehydrase/lipid transport superfamily protein [Citrus sinensis]|uniref:Polyketide cyclase/dehydrase/lipid transport superfamily protein n=1 Tax=Citrus sinensis TaxID=2711 RepID=A0ACB8JZ18_CITSI|nr:polyketide cyclase/dehydrase/lipid transport superfamily protein [Citrus sinensis]